VATQYSIDDPAKTTSASPRLRFGGAIHVLFVYVLASGSARRSSRSCSARSDAADQRAAGRGGTAAAAAGDRDATALRSAAEISIESRSIRADHRDQQRHERSGPWPRRRRGAEAVESRSSRQPPSTVGRGARISQPRVSARVAPCRRGRHGHAEGVRAGHRRVGEVQVRESSGFPKLDEAASGVQRKLAPRARQEEASPSPCGTLPGHVQAED